jgi:hypothetical protein
MPPATPGTPAATAGAAEAAGAIRAVETGTSQLTPDEVSSYNTELARLRSELPDLNRQITDLERRTSPTPPAGLVVPSQEAAERLKGLIDGLEAKGDALDKPFATGLGNGLSTDTAFTGRYTNVSEATASVNKLVTARLEVVAAKKELAPAEKRDGAVERMIQAIEYGRARTKIDKVLAACTDGANVNAKPVRTTAGGVALDDLPTREEFEMVIKFEEKEAAKRGATPTEVQKLVVMRQIQMDALAKTKEDGTDRTAAEVLNPFKSSRGAEYKSLVKPATPAAAGAPPLGVDGGNFSVLAGKVPGKPYSLLSPEDKAQITAIKTMYATHPDLGTYVKDLTTAKINGSGVATDRFKEFRTLMQAADLIPKRSRLTSADAAYGAIKNFIERTAAPDDTRNDEANLSRLQAQRTSNRDRIRALESALRTNTPIVENSQAGNENVNRLRERRAEIRNRLMDPNLTAEERGRLMDESDELFAQIINGQNAPAQAAVTNQIQELRNQITQMEAQRVEREQQDKKNRLRRNMMLIGAAVGAVVGFTTPIGPALLMSIGVFGAVGTQVVKVGEQQVAINENDITVKTAQRDRLQQSLANVAAGTPEHTRATEMVTQLNGEIEKIQKRQKWFAPVIKAMGYIAPAASGFALGAVLGGTVKVAFDAAVNNAVSAKMAAAGATPGTAPGAGAATAPGMGGGELGVGGFQANPGDHLNLPGSAWNGTTTSHLSSEQMMAGGLNNPSNFSGGIDGMTAYRFAEGVKASGAPDYATLFSGADGAVSANAHQVLNAMKGNTSLDFAGAYQSVMGQSVPVAPAPIG